MSADKPKHGTNPTEHQNDVIEPSVTPTETVEASAAPTTETPQKEGGIASARFVSGSGASTHPTG